MLEKRLGAELLAVSAAALRPYGLDAEEILRSRGGVASSGGRTPVARKLFQDVYALGELATEWTENASYVDKAGQPRVLPIRGKTASFASLARKHFGRRSVLRVLEFAEQTRVVERVGTDQVAQINACVMLTGNRLLMLARAVLSVRWLLGAAQANGRATSEHAELWPDRQAYAVVPKEHFEAFADQMRPQLYNLADVTNRWLTKHAVRDQPRIVGSKSGLVGVHAYVFHE
ncbi:MAG TPA: hypothetical protein VNF49_14215 [Candidatus Binataceae bacterium]|nr:hypothetical protein [Candidatus Binataceae bacterium]